MKDDKYWEDLIKEVDHNQNGEIEFEEFELMLSKMMEN